jgi:hypothetical protein
MPTNTKQTDPRAAPPAKPETPAKKKELTTEEIVGIVFGVLFLFVFNLGAAYLSYSKYQSFGWAALDFVFAVFYYPVYAFFLNGTTAAVSPVVPAMSPMYGGGKKAMKYLSKLLKV